jgi:Potential Queuosine, Q, salvage protein family
MPSVSLPEEVRAACAWVAREASFVRIDEGGIDNYADALLRAEAAASAAKPCAVARDPEAAAAFAICMNAINFGSGWWPTIHKRPGHSGYGTIAAGVSEHFATSGPWRPPELAAMDAGTIAAVVGQDPDHPLMGEFAAALRDVGAHLLGDYDGRYLAVAEGVESAPALAETFASWDCFADVSSYRGREVPFYKRAQLAAADLQRAGLLPCVGIEHLTAFADNLVPHVLRIDGLLQLDPGLVARIEAGDLLRHGSPEEVELRAAAVHTVELLVGAMDGALAPAQIDSALWNRGRERRYKSVPRPRSRNTAY